MSLFTASLSAMTAPVDTSTKALNPYNALLEECEYKSAKIEQNYSQRRSTQHNAQKELFTSPEFKGILIDPILRDLVAEEHRPAEAKTGYKDTRNCLVLWTRPPERVKELVKKCQEELLDVLPNLWCMPRESLHMTVLELVHSRTPDDLEWLVGSISEDLIEKVTTLPNVLAKGQTTNPRFARLYKPMLVFDAKGIALTFLPVPFDRKDEAEFSYHELRSKLWSCFAEEGVEVASRYVAASAHVTVGRFISEDEILASDKRVDRVRIAKLIETIDEINIALERDYGNEEALWSVGEEKGLVFRRGTLWYGGGTTISQGPPL